MEKTHRKETDLHETRKEISGRAAGRGAGAGGVHRLKRVSPALQYDTQLEYAAERIAQWMTEEVTNLTTADGQLVRKVQLDPGTGNMNPGISVNEFISDSTNGSLYLSSNVKIALTMDNSGNPYYDPGRLYAPAAQDAVEALRSEAEGCSRMGAVFIEYSGGTYVVALFL